MPRRDEWVESLVKLSDCATFTKSVARIVFLGFASKTLHVPAHHQVEELCGIAKFVVLEQGRGCRSRRLKRGLIAEEGLENSPCGIGFLKVLVCFFRCPFFVEIESMAVVVLQLMFQDAPTFF
jgi:hypothetical protein